MSSQPFQIPDKTMYKIGEVARMLEVEAHVLRYWESEFEMLDPDKTKSGQRIYGPEDIQLLARIRDLLYVEMFTIAGARRQLQLDPENDLTHIARDEYDTLHAERDALAAQLAEAQAAREADTSALAALTEERDALITQLADAAQEHELAAAQVEALHQQLSAAQDRLEERAAQIAAIEATSSSTEDVEAHWRDQVASLQAQIEQLEDALTDARRQALAVSQQRDSMTVDHEAYRREAHHQRQRRRDLIRSISAQLGSLQRLAATSA